MTFRAFVVEITDPNGTKFDVSDRLAMESVGNLSEEVEDDLTQLTHSDISLTLDDFDGFVSAIFTGAERGDSYEVVVIRETGQRRIKSERVFAGIVSVPLGIKRDSMSRMLTLDCYSYSKLCELTSAETLRRSIGTVTGSTTTGYTTLTLSSTSLLAVGDLITLTGASANQQFTITEVTSSVQVSVTTASSYTFVAVPVTLDTTWYRGKTVQEIADIMFPLAGMDDNKVNVSQELSSTPFASDPSVVGLPSTVPAGILENNANSLRVYAGSTIHDYSASSVTSGWTDNGATTAKCDWRPYNTSAPATLRAVNGADDGTRAWDYSGGNYYELQTSGNDLQLMKNGVLLATVVTKGVNDDWIGHSLDVDNVATEIWVGYWYARYNPSAEFLDCRSALKVYNAAGTLQRTPSGNGGYIRASRSVSLVAVVAPTLSGLPFAEPIITWDQPIKLYTTGTTTVALSLGMSYTAVPDLPDNPILWTLRQFSTFYACVRKTSDGRTVVDVWSSSTGELLSSLQIAAATSARNLATIFDVGGTATPNYFGYAGGEYFTISTEFSSVIPYADFSGKSIAAAARELAIISGAHFYVDDYKTAVILGRNSDPIRSAEPIPISDPLDQMTMPVWEWLRSGVTVSGQDEDGVDVEASVGDIGDSALTLSVSVDLPLTSGLAGALANSYYSTLGVTRTQSDEIVLEPDDGPVRVLDLVSRDGITYRVLRVETNFADETQRLQLAEEV